MTPIGTLAVGPAAERDDAERAAMVAALLHLHEGARAAGELGDQMRRGLARRHDVATTAAGASGAQLSGRSFSTLPSTRVTPGSAAQALGRDLRGAAGDDDARIRAVRVPARRIAWRAWRSASAVTAQVLTMTVSVQRRRRARASPRSRRRSGGSRMSAPRRSCGIRREIDLAGEGGGDRAGHQHVAVRRATRSPVSPPSRSTVARRPVRPRRCALTSAAQAPEPQASVRPGAAFPDAQPDSVGGQHLGEADIGTLGKDRVHAPGRPDRRRPASRSSRRRKTSRAGCPC